MNSKRFFPGGAFCGPALRLRRSRRAANRGRPAAGPRPHGDRARGGGSRAHRGHRHGAPRAACEIAAKVMGAIEEMPFIARPARARRRPAGEDLRRRNLRPRGPGAIPAEPGRSAISTGSASSSPKAPARPTWSKASRTALRHDPGHGARGRGHARLCLVRAPFDGVVARKLADVGDLAAPGDAAAGNRGLRTISRLRPAFPIRSSRRLAPGAALAVEVPAAGVRFHRPAGRSILGGRSLRRAR